VNSLSLKAGGMSDEKICETLDGIVGRLKGLKRKVSFSISNFRFIFKVSDEISSVIKLEDAKQKEEEQLRRAKARLDHLST